MAWNAPITWVANTVLTAAQLNAQLRDNISETAPAKATTAGSHFVTTGANAVAERRIVSATVATAGVQTGTTGYDVILNGANPSLGPAVTLTTGANALVWISCRGVVNTATEQGLASFEISGATTSNGNAALDPRAVIFSSTTSARQGICAQITTLTPGTNTFTMKYRHSVTTAGHTSTYSDRTIVVMGL